MILGLPVLVILHAVCAALYAVLAALILVRQRSGRAELSRTGIFLAGACLVTALWALTVALSWTAPLAGLANLLDIGRALAWYAFLLHLYRRTVPAEQRMARIFTAMGLLVVLVLACLPLFDYFGWRVDAVWWLGSVGARLALAVCSVLLIENLYFNAAKETRWHLNLLCVAIGGLALYDLLPGVCPGS